MQVQLALQKIVSTDSHYFCVTENTFESVFIRCSKKCCNVSPYAEICSWLVTRFDLDCDSVASTMDSAIKILSTHTDAASVKPDARSTCLR